MIIVLPSILHVNIVTVENAKSCSGIIYNIEFFMNVTIHAELTAVKK